jgi:hypothetical protein
LCVVLHICVSAVVQSIAIGGRHETNPGPTEGNDEGRPTHSTNRCRPRPNQIKSYRATTPHPASSSYLERRRGLALLAGGGGGRGRSGATGGGTGLVGRVRGGLPHLLELGRALRDGCLEEEEEEEEVFRGVCVWAWVCFIELSQAAFPVCS